MYDWVAVCAMQRGKNKAINVAGRNPGRWDFLEIARIGYVHQYWMAHVSFACVNYTAKLSSSQGLQFNNPRPKHPSAAQLHDTLKEYFILMNYSSCKYNATLRGSRERPPVPFERIQLSLQSLSHDFTPHGTRVHLRARNWVIVPVVPIRATNKCEMDVATRATFRYLFVKRLV